MVPQVVTERWLERAHEIETIRADLFEKYPNLHVFINQDEVVEIAGSFPVLGACGEELDRYSVSIILPKSYPKDLPKVYEVGGRLPHNSNYHINNDGSACVLIPDDRWQCFPEGAPFLHYLDVPLRNFFLSQTYYEEKGIWPFGQWSHGKEGVFEYYRWLLGSVDNLTIHRFLHILKKNNLKKHYDCPCGSGHKIKKCCLTKIRDLRSKIFPQVASKALNSLDLDGLKPPYRRSQLR
jgi:hypothetical protein